MTRLNRLLAGLLLGSFLALPARTQPDATRQAFEEGNRHYEAGAWHEAVAAYEQVLQQGYESGTVHYHLGNAYFRLDRLGLAILHYEKALRLMPARREVHHNLEIARSRLPDQFPQLPVPWWTQVWHLLVQRLGAGVLFILGLLAYLVAVGLLAWRIRTHTRNPWHRRALALSALLGAVLLLAALAASVETATPRAGVLLAAEAALRETPDETAPAPLTLHEGVRLDLLRTAPEWWQVRLPNGTTGWLRAETIGTI